MTGTEKTRATIAPPPSSPSPSSQAPSSTSAGGFNVKRFVKKVAGYVFVLAALDQLSVISRSGINFLGAVKDPLLLSSSSRMRSLDSELSSSVAAAAAAAASGSNNDATAPSETSPATFTTNVIQEGRNDTTVVVYCNVSSYVEAATAQAKAETGTVAVEMAHTASRVIAKHIDMTLHSMDQVFVGLNPKSNDSVFILLDGAPVEGWNNSMISIVEHTLHRHFENDTNVQVVNVGKRRHKAIHANSTTLHSSSPPTSHHSFTTLGVVESLRHVIQDIHTTFMYVVMSHQPFANPPYRYMSRNVFGRSKWKVPLNFRQHRRFGGTATEPSRPVHIDHFALCRSIQTHPNQLSRHPIRFVSSYYASQHLKDSGTGFEDDITHECLDRSSMTSSSSSSSSSSSPHLPVQLFVNDDTVGLVDDIEAYNDYLTNETLQRRRYVAQSQDPLTTLHFFKSNEVVETENHFVMTQYYRDRLLVLGDREQQQQQQHDEEVAIMQRDTGKNHSPSSFCESLPDSQYVYGKPFTRIAHFLFHVRYMGEIYVDSLDKNPASIVE